MFSAVLRCDLVFCTQLYLVHKYVVICSSAFSYLNIVRLNCQKTVKVTVKCTVKITLTVSHYVGSVLTVTKGIFVYIRQRYSLHCNSVHILQ
jgi:hypothetical protein